MHNCGGLRVLEWQHHRFAPMEEDKRPGENNVDFVTCCELTLFWASDFSQP
jgi:hypothetical protein